MDRKQSTSQTKQGSQHKHGNQIPKISLDKFKGEDLLKLQTPIAQVESLQHIIRGTAPPPQVASSKPGELPKLELVPTTLSSTRQQIVETVPQNVNSFEHHHHQQHQQNLEPKHGTYAVTENGELVYDGAFFDPSMLLQYTDPFTMAKMNIGESTLPNDLITTDSSGALISAGEMPLLETEDGTYVEKYSSLPLYDLTGQGFYSNGFPMGFGTHGVQLPVDWGVNHSQGGYASLEESPPGIISVHVESNNNVNEQSPPSGVEKGSQQLPPIQASLLAFGENTDPNTFSSADYIQG